MVARVEKRRIQLLLSGGYTTIIRLSNVLPRGLEPQHDIFQNLNVSWYDPLADRNGQASSLCWDLRKFCHNGYSAERTIVTGSSHCRRARLLFVRSLFL